MCVRVCKEVAFAVYVMVRRTVYIRDAMGTNRRRNALLEGAVGSMRAEGHIRLAIFQRSRGVWHGKVHGGVCVAWEKKLYR